MLGVEMVQTGGELLQLLVPVKFSSIATGVAAVLLSPLLPQAESRLIAIIRLYRQIFFIINPHGVLLSGANKNGSARCFPKHKRLSQMKNMRFRNPTYCHLPNTNSLEC